eukprot:GEMP01017592.1.p1 GENE.GEMP01017592.1~~GEMP01017592.1.p1  ORF type:complete len:598 (+),score=157.34 GEMP01017592.1:82-1875(+)
MELFTAVLSRLVKVAGQGDVVLEGLLRQVRESHIEASDATILKKASAESADTRDEIHSLKCDVGELKDMLCNNKGEVNNVRRIVLACERDIEDFTAAMDAVNVDLDEMRARVDATHSIITSRQRAEATMTAEISTLRLDLTDVQETLKNHDSWMEDVSNTLRQMDEKEAAMGKDIGMLKRQVVERLDGKVDSALWNSRNEDADAAIGALREMLTAFRLESDAQRQKAEKQLMTLQNDLGGAERNLNQMTCSLEKHITESAIQLSNRIDAAVKDVANFQESTHVTQNSLSDCFNEVAVARGDFERCLAETETSLKTDIRQKQQEGFEKLGLVDQKAEQNFGEASRRLCALDLRMSGMQGGLGEDKRDIRTLREAVNSLTVKAATHDGDINKVQDATRQFENKQNVSEDNLRTQLGTVHELLDSKVDEKSYEDCKHYLASLTKGVVKFAQVVGVFPGPRFDEDDGLGGDTEADSLDLLGWEECAENMSYRVDKVWRQRCSQRFRNILDMISKKADHSVLRLLQISQQHIESQLERLKQERELWKEIVDRRQPQPTELAVVANGEEKKVGPERNGGRFVMTEPRFSPLSKRLTRPVSSQG